MDEQLWSPIVELRRYTLHPGRREDLIEIFENRFIEGQEQAGMKVIGQFREPADPNRFTWLRGFPNMGERERSLTEFYGGPVWAANRNAANSTMVDSDDVLLLRPVRAGSAFRLPVTRPSGENSSEGGDIEVMTLHVQPGAEMDAAANVGLAITALSAGTRPRVLGLFVTEHSPNTYPRLPVREKVNVVVVFTGAVGDAAGLREALSSTPGLAGSPEARRLSPIRRSLLRATPPRDAARV